jgi:hypothetical protein
MGWQGKYNDSLGAPLIVTGAATSAAVTVLSVLFSSSWVLSAALFSRTLDGAGSDIPEKDLRLCAHYEQKVPTFCAGNKYVHSVHF